MTDDPKLYKKLNSFVGIRQKKALPDLLPRIRWIREALSGSSLDESRKAVVRQACDELLGDVRPKDRAAFSIHENVAEEIARLDDAELPRYLFYRYRYEMYPVLKKIDDYPPCLQIEPTSVCNYRCVFCYQVDAGFTRKEEGHMGNIPLPLFQKVVDQAEGQVEAITLASRGEPLLHPKIREMLGYVRGKFLALKLNTNASMLDEAKCHALLEAGLNTLVFSVDAAVEPLYSQLRVGGNLDRVLKNIERFQNIRLKQYPKSRVITRVSGVKVPGTPELDEMEKVWGNLVDQVVFVHYNPWQNTYERDVNDIVDPCTALWFRMFVWWDGRANPCDNDYKSTLVLGNASEKTVSELWRSPKFAELRERHGSGKRGTCYPCDRCPVV